MNIALLNVKITIQKSEVLVDEIGNHINRWSDFHCCYSTVGGESGIEKNTGVQVMDDSDITFSIRYCKKVAELTSIGYQVLFQNDIYNILTIDHMNYKKKSIKLRCQRVRK